VKERKSERAKKEWTPRRFTFARAINALSRRATKRAEERFYAFSLSLSLSLGSGL
jgi:hypothetical protein